MSDNKKLIEEIRGWKLPDYASDDAKRKQWLLKKAADRIEALEAENAQLKADMDVALAACGAENERLRGALLDVVSHFDKCHLIADALREVLEMKP